MMPFDNGPMSEICVTAAYESLPLAPTFRPSRSPLLEAFLRNLAGSDRIAVLTLDAPLVDPAALLTLEDRDGFVYLPPAGPQFSGLGRVVELVGRGSGRFAEIEAQAAVLAPRFEALALGRSEARAHFFGGFAFAPGGADAGPWEAFGDASFVLPRWLYRRQGELASLSLCLLGAELGSESRRHSWLAALEARVAALATAQAPRGGRGSRLRVSFPPATEITRRIDKIGAAIAAGAVDKVVTALRFEVELLERPQLLRTFRRLTLAAAGSDATTFFFRRGDATFLGATPELLVSRCGEVLRSEALAGSWRHDRPLIDFLRSSKNSREHDLVVAAIEDALAPLCRHLEVAPKDLRHLRGLSHLYTAIEGRLEKPLHLLQLAARLHPTPAVGGWPRLPALELLAATETEPRGWYAGPIGYFDAAGNGELRVALRSGIVQRNQALIYAGAGIVAGSEARDELAEMVSKARPMLDALGGVRAFEPVHPGFTPTRQASQHGPRKTPGRSRAA